MDQKTKTPKPEDGSKGGQDFFDAKIESKVEGVEDMLKGIDKVLDEKTKLKPLKCCGILPCKGRTPACYGCAICMDCITGAGCGHSNSAHKPQSGYSLD